MNPPQTKRYRIMRRCLIVLAVCLTLIGLFYTEENWRGERDWANCKSALEAQGVKMNWADYIPAPMPDDQNVFGVPEMQKWFTGRGETELSKKFLYPGYGGTNTARLVVAELKIDLPEASAPSGSNAAVLKWSDPRARTEAARLIKDALGPMATDPRGFNHMLRGPKEIQPARIILQCQTAPTEKELLQFLPTPIANSTFPEHEKIQVESVGDGSYKVTMLAPDTMAEYLRWSEQLEPEFTLIRHTLQRPYARMNGNYNDPVEVPIPNFVTVRAMVQVLAAMAQCHLLQGKPEDALRDLTLIHDLCRILQDSRPMTLVSAMINTAVTGLYSSTIADGLRWQAWREPQLASLEEQLRQINILTPVQQAFEVERVSFCHFLETEPPTKVVKLFFNTPGQANSWHDQEELVIARLIPRGWVCQNAVTYANLFTNAIAGMDIDPGSQIVFPDKVAASIQRLNAFFSHWSPYSTWAARMTPNFSRAVQTTARNQTMANQALIACALERWHLARGEYPEMLAAVAPQFITSIPHDVIGGQPLHYRRASDGTFLLYSVGWNGRDDGGVTGKTSEDGDWVWPIVP